MDRQTLRDWVHRFNATAPEGLIDNWTEGPKPRLSAEQLAEFAVIVETGPDRERDGVVRWRRADLKRVIAEQFGAICPARGAALASLYADTEATQLHLDQISRHVAEGAHGVVLLATGPDGARLATSTRPTTSPRSSHPRVPRTEPGRERLAAPSVELALQPRL